MFQKIQQKKFEKRPKEWEFLKQDYIKEVLKT